MSGIAITFPGSSAEGQSYLAQNGFTYIYDSQKNRWKRGGDFVRAPKVLSYAGIAATTTGSGITTGPTGSLIYVIPGTVNPSSDVGVDSYKAYRYTDSYPNYTEIQVSISSAFSTIAYAATFTGTTYTVPSSSLSGDTTYYIRARQFVGPTASAASTGAISGYSQNIVRFITTSVYIDAPTIVSIAGTTGFPAYQIGFAGTTLPATVTYTGSGVGNLQQVEWRVTGPRNPDSTGDTALAEVGIGTFSSATLANALVLAMPFSGATGVGITNDVNNAIRTASGASAGTTKTITNVGVTTVAVGIATTTSHFYPNAAYFGTPNYLTTPTGADFSFGTSDFTIEAWVYVNSTHGTIWSTSTDQGDWKNIGTGYFNFNTSGSINYQNTGGSQGNFNPIITTPFKSWNHVCAVRRSGVLTVYLNGSSNGSDANIGTVGNVSSGIPGIGRWDSFSGGRGYFDGYIQDLKIYKGLAKYTESFTPPLPSYGTISYTTNTIGSVGVATTSFNQSTGDIPTAEVAIGSSTAAQVASSLVLAMPMNRTFGFQDINVAVRGLTSGASAGTAKTVGLGTTSTANAPSHPKISSTESKWYDGAAYFDGGDYLSVGTSNDYLFGTGDFTIESWFYLTTNASRQDLCGNYSGASTGWGVALGDASSNGMYFYYGNTTYATTSAGLWSTNTWNHIALSRQSGTLSIYLNGNRVSSASATVDVSTTSYSTLIGAVTNTSGNPQLYCTGYLQDFKIYKGFAKYTANFTPPQPICGFTTDLAIQTGFTTTTATGSLLSSVVGLGSTSTLAFAADQTYAGITSITSSSGITTLPDPYAQNLVLALPLANITGAGNSFTNDRNTQIRSVSITGAGVTAGATKAITNSGVSTVSLGSTGKWYGNTAFFGTQDASLTILYVNSTTDLNFGTGDFTVECWVNPTYINTASAAVNIIVGAYPASGITYWQWGYDGSSNQTMYLWYNGSRQLTASKSPMSTNTWYHVAWTRRDGVMSLWKDGLLIGTLNYSSTVDIQGGEQLSIGGYGTLGPGDFTNDWDGYIQDFRAYKGVAKYNTNFTPPPPMFGDYTRSTPNKIVFTPGSDYVLEARNTATGGIVTSTYSATRQWGTKPKGGIYDPYASNLILALPMNNTTTLYDVTGQIKLETPTSSYSSGQTVTSPSGSTYTNRSMTNNNTVTFTTGQYKYYGYSGTFASASSQTLTSGTSSGSASLTGDFTVELWAYKSSGSNYMRTISGGNSGGHIWTLGFDTTWGSGLVFNWYDGTDYYSRDCSSLTAHTGVWYHLAVSRLARTNTLYYWLNGINVGTSNVSANYTANEFIIGNRRSANEYWNGYMQDIRVYSGICKYTSNFTPPNQIYLT